MIGYPFLGRAAIWSVKALLTFRGSCCFYFLLLRMKQHVHCGVIWGINTKPNVESKESHKNLQKELAFEPTHETFII
jgi:hypothetical protein